MVLDTLKEKWNNFKTGLTTQVDKRFSKKQVERNEINQKLDHQRQMAQGRLKQEEKKRKEAEQLAESGRKQKAGEYLQSRQEALSKKNLENAVSLRKIFREIDQGNLKVGLTNQSRNATFGTLEDILVDDRGMMYIVNDEGGFPIGGGTWGDIVQSPSGMLTDILAGYLPLNLSPEGKHLPSSETVQVPEIVETEDGIVFTENHTEKYKNQLARKQDQIKTLAQENAMKEKAMVGMAEELRKKDRQLDTLKVVAESEQESREKVMDMAENAIQQYRQQEIEINKTDSVKEFWEEIGKAVFNAQSEAVDDIIEEVDKEALDTKEEEIRRAIKMFTEEAGKMQELAPAQQSGGGESGGSDSFE